MSTLDRSHLRRGGIQHRVADPDWADPLDVAHSARAGGRWNPAGAFGALYLNATVAVARANVNRLFDGLPYGPEDLDNTSAPLLVDVDVAFDDYVDAVTNRGLTRLGLPATYPVDAGGEAVEHSTCHPVGAAAYEDGEPGIACRSAAPGVAGEELVWFSLPGRALPRHVQTRSFDEWFWRSPSADG